MVLFEAWRSMDVVTVIDREALNVVVNDTWIAHIRNIHYSTHVDSCIWQVDTKSLHGLCLRLLLCLQLHLRVRRWMYQSVLLRLTLRFAIVKTLCISNLVFILDVKIGFHYRVTQSNLRSLCAILGTVRGKVSRIRVIDPLIFKDLALLNSTTLEKLVRLETSVLVTVETYWIWTNTCIIYRVSLRQPSLLMITLLLLQLGNLIRNRRCIQILRRNLCHFDHIFSD